jgi:ribosome-associated protein
MEGLDVGDGVTIPLVEIELQAARSSGPGGQHANVTASRVVAVFDVRASAALSDEQRARLLERLGPRVSAVAQDARGQLRNRALALERLRAKLEAGLRVPRTRRPSRPTLASRERRLAAKRVDAQRKATRRPPQPED